MACRPQCDVARIREFVCGALLALATENMRSWLVLATLLLGCVDEDLHEDDETALFEAAYDDGLLEPKEDGTDCSGVRVPDRPGFGKKIALTFDDGPNPATTPKVMAILRRQNVPATFFTNGSRYGATGAKQIAMDIAADPLFILANHSQRHIDLAQQTAQTVRTEIDKTDALLRGAGESPRYFRFPFGSATCSAKATAQSRGYIVTGWHVDTADWCFAAGSGICKPETFRYVPDDMRTSMRKYVVSQVRANAGGIVLFHDIHASTANNLEEIIEALKAEGYTFVRLDDTTVFPKLHGMAPAPVTTKFIGDKCQSDADCAFTAGGQAGRCDAAKFCTIRCDGTCPDLAGKAPTFCIRDAALVATGMCVSRPSNQNASCAALPLTTLAARDRFIGTSTAAPATANVCAPR
jgi:peptidoglycan/xylan/chitin deacetylase (PgdA/CDA1 family)